MVIKCLISGSSCSCYDNTVCVYVCLVCPCVSVCAHHYAYATTVYSSQNLTAARHFIAV